MNMVLKGKMGSGKLGKGAGCDEGPCYDAIRK